MLTKFLHRGATGLVMISDSVIGREKLMKTQAAVLIVWLAGISYAQSAQPMQIDTGKSVMKVHVFKSGIFSAFGHEHTSVRCKPRHHTDATTHAIWERQEN